MIMIDSTIVQIAIVMLHISDIDDDGDDNDDDWEQMRVEIAQGRPWHGELSTI